MVKTLKDQGPLGMSVVQISCRRLIPVSKPVLFMTMQCNRQRKSVLQEMERVWIVNSSFRMLPFISDVCY